MVINVMCYFFWDTVYIAICTWHWVHDSLRTVNSKHVCLLYLAVVDGWEYTDSGSLAFAAAYQTGNPSCMDSVVHQILQQMSTQTHVYNANRHLYYDGIINEAPPVPWLLFRY